jgi:hypothetical protein
MNLRKLAVEWAKEISVPAAEIEDRLLDAAFEGEFKDLFARDNRVGIAMLDPDSGAAEVFAGPDLAERLMAAAWDAELTFYYFARSAKEAELYAIHRDAVLHFAAQRRLAPPSWWSV